MKVLFLATEKVLLQSSPQEWQDCFQGRKILFTGFGKRKSKDLLFQMYQNSFDQIYFFENYEYNDLLEIEIIKLFGKEKFDEIISFSEVDVMRAARVREVLDLKGQKPDEAVYFRDKIKMKELAVVNGINCPQFTRIKNVIELNNFIKKVGFPIVIKPILGRGSWETHIFKNQISLDSFLVKGGLSKTYRLPDLLAEEYIHGNMYMIDALFVNKKEAFCSIASCYTRPIEFLQGGFGSVYRLKFDNPKYIKIKEIIHKLVLEVFPTQETSLYHIELFENIKGEFILCEIACRMGGVAINEEFKLTYKFDLKMKLIECMLNDIDTDEFPYKPKNDGTTSVGWVVFPPKSGQIATVKNAKVKIKQLLAYGLPNNQLKKKYGQAQLTNCEVATFIFDVETELKAQQKIDEISEWVEENIEWTN